MRWVPQWWDVAMLVGFLRTARPCCQWWRRRMPLGVASFWRMLCFVCFALVVQLQQVAHPMALRGLQQFGWDQYLFIGVR